MAQKKSHRLWKKKTCKGRFSSNDLGPTAPGHLELTQHFEVLRLSLMPTTNKTFNLQWQLCWSTKKSHELPGKRSFNAERDAWVQILQSKIDAITLRRIPSLDRLVSNAFIFSLVLIWIANRILCVTWDITCDRPLHIWYMRVYDKLGLKRQLRSTLVWAALLYFFRYGTRWLGWWSSHGVLQDTAIQRETFLSLLEVLWNLSGLPQPEDCCLPSLNGMLFPNLLYLYHCSVSKLYIPERGHEW